MMMVQFILDILDIYLRTACGGFGMDRSLLTIRTEVSRLKAATKMVMNMDCGAIIMQMDDSPPRVYMTMEQKSVNGNSGTRMGRLVCRNFCEIPEVAGITQ